MLLAQCCSCSRAIPSPATSTAHPNATVSSSTTQQLSLLRAHARAGRMQPARQLFDAMPATDRSLLAWTVLMSGYATHGPAAEALLLFLRMLQMQQLQPDAFVFSVVTRACASLGSLRCGRQLHCAALKLGYVAADLFVANGLVTMYASCGSLGCAQEVFRGIAFPDLVSWTSMLSGYTENGCDGEALLLFVRMACAGVGYDAFALSVALRAAANLGHVRLGFQLHCCMIKMGFKGSSFLENCLIEFYGRAGELWLMQKVFDEMSNRDLVSWNTIIRCYSDNHCDEEALELFRALMYECLQCDEFTFGSILRAITSLGAFDHGKEIHGYVVRAGLDSDKHVMSALLDMYVNWGILDDKYYILPLRMLRYYLSVRGQLDEFIVASGLKSCASDLHLAAGKMLHACISKFDMNSDVFVISSLIDMYAKCGSLEESFLLFTRIKDPGTVLWSSIISGNCWNGQFERALYLFRRMQLAHVRANEFTYTSALLACIAQGDVAGGMEIHSNAIRSGYGSHIPVLRTLTSLYVRKGLFPQVLHLCLSLPSHEISWGALVHSFAQVDDHFGILNLFHVIQCAAGELDSATASHVLNSCGRLALLGEGLQGHAYITKRGLTSETQVNNALIDMYSNCGSLGHAFDAFRYMPDKSASSWTSIIVASMENGYPERAVNLFVQMLRRGKSPTSDTFLSVLKACAEIGLVNEAFQFFASMTEVYKIQPSEEHYSHIIVVLGHAGMFREAEHFIDSVIPSESGASAWTLLFSAAKEHRKIKTARLAAEKLAKLVSSDRQENASLHKALVASDGQ